MNRLNLFRNPLHRWLGREEPRPTIPIKELRERDRRRMLRHFLLLEGRDRLLRFGSVLTDEQVGKYRDDFLGAPIWSFYWGAANSQPSDAPAV